MFRVGLAVKEILENCLTAVKATLAVVSTLQIKTRFEIYTG